MCCRGEIASWALAERRSLDRSIFLRARIGQKCDMRGTLKNTVNQVEGLIGLRSGGLPQPHCRKILDDRVNLSVTMRDILFGIFRKNPNVPNEDLQKLQMYG